MILFRAITVMLCVKKDMYVTITPSIRLPNLSKKNAQARKYPSSEYIHCLTLENFLLVGRLPVVIIVFGKLTRAVT